MSKPMRYSVQWDCPHCGNSHNWWWEDEFEAYSEGESDMLCDRCDTSVKCVGDGHGFYVPVEKTEPDGDTSARIKTLFDAVNSLAKRVAKIEGKLAALGSDD